MKRASFLCLLALGAHATSPDAVDRNRIETAGLQASTEETFTTPATPNDQGTSSHAMFVAAAVISAQECRAYAHTRDNVVTKPRSRRSKAYCNFDELRHRDA